MRTLLIALLLFASSASAAGQTLPEGVENDPKLGLWNPLRVAPDNQPQIVKVLVLNYDPIAPAEGHKRLTKIFGWGDAAEKAAGYKALMERASGGYLQFEIVEWRNLNELYAQEDGQKYTIEEYVRNRRSNSGWREKAGSADYPRIMSEQNVAPLIDDGLVDEVWIFSDHFFGLWEASMAGPRSFYINGGVYPRVPSQRPFAFYGFNYERAVAEMAHNTCHRTEATMNRIYGGWNLKAPSTNWDKFSANHDQSGGVAGVGTCHFPANARKAYGYGNPREVLSWADDFLDYPHLNGERKPVSVATWTDGDNQRGYMRWYFAHLPRAPGVNEDGRQNNWWKYLYDFDNYTDKGAPKPPTARLQAGDLYEFGGSSHLIKVAYQSPVPIDVATFGDDDLSVVGPSGTALQAKFVAASDHRNGTYRVAAYRVAAPAGAWRNSDRGAYAVNLRPDAVKCTTGKAFGAAALGAFLVRSTEPESIAADAYTLLLLNEKLTAGDNEMPLANENIGRAETPFGSGAHFGKGALLAYACEGHIQPAQGSIELWIKPDWDGKAGTHRVLLQAGQGFNNGLVLMIDGANNLRLLVWGDDPATEQVETNQERGVGVSTNDWKAGEWHHVAATWDLDQARELSLYVDGKLADEAGNGVRVPEFSRKRVTLGCAPRGENSCLAVLDEIRISRRCRTASEIASTYSASLGLGNLSIEPANITLDLSQRVALRVFAESAGGARRDVTSLARWSIDQPTIARLDRHGNVVATSAGKAMIGATIGTLRATVNLDVRGEAPPTARLVQPIKLPVAGKETVRIEVEYADKGGDGIDTASLDNSDVRVGGPAGFHQFATFSVLERRGQSVVARYELQAPDGGWQAAPAGRYKIELKAWQVHSANGRFAAETLLGTFESSAQAAPDAL